VRPDPQPAVPFNAPAVPLDAPATLDAPELLRSVRRLEQRLSDVIDGALQELSLTTSLYLVLEALDREPRIHTSQIARALGITRQSVRAHVVKLQRLQRMDLIELLPLDLGVRGLMLTDRGARRLMVARDEVRDVLTPLSVHLSTTDLGSLTDTADRAVRALRPRVDHWWLG
jgi:DNA-binding MarR family transcriptional regulator